jgi:hypothetical protein
MMAARGRRHRRLASCVKSVSSAGAVADIQLVKLEAGVAGDLGEPPLLEAHIVRVVQVVDADDGVAVGQQQFRDLRADKPGCAGDEIGGHTFPFWAA